VKSFEGSREHSTLQQHAKARSIEDCHSALELVTHCQPTIYCLIPNRECGAKPKHATRPKGSRLVPMWVARWRINLSLPATPPVL